MEVAASVGTELALSGLTRVISKLASNFGGDVTPDEMEHLNVFVGYKIEALIREAKSDDLVKSAPLLEKLQAAALELEDLLDLYEYNQLEKQVSSSSSSSNPMKKFISNSKKKLGPILPKSPLRIGVEKLLKSIEQAENIYPFVMSRKGTTQPQANTVTPKTSTLSSPFYGREDQCDTIIKLLLDESHAHLNSRRKYVPIIAIRGLGGAGKTTTAQHVYNENTTVNYFDLRMWVHVTRGIDERRLIIETIESAEGKECAEISSLDVLQKKLKDSVSNKKFLLVLDDVWEDDAARLDIVLSPLNQVGVKGSKIILTTRMEKAAKHLNAKHIILLDELKDEDCWSILKYYAFGDNEEITIEDHRELKYIGNQIISKVKHSPLALKVVGSSLLNKRSANEWEKVLQQEDILKDTMDLLLFSYQCLPLHLQRCFAYCSLFPKGYEFKFNVNQWEPHLISLWIAQGFIENTSELAGVTVGHKYIEELLSYSFFEISPGYGRFIIHDLLHDLAEMVSKKQCHRVEQYDTLNVPTSCIHLSLCITENLVSMDQSTILAISDIFNLRNLRSLIVLGHVRSVNIFESKKDIFQNLTKLRALYVGECHYMEVLSDPRIDKLKHLRYLHMPYNTKLSVSFAKLYLLQFFILITNQEDYKYLPANTLPQGFNNLTNLHTLQFHNGGYLLDYLYYNSKMINIEKLTLLQNLENFYVDGFNGLISLRNLPLGGSLSILNLENVKCKERAEEAMLNQKHKIDELNFVWSDTPSSINTCEKVLEGLEPHRNLKQLKIKGYQGVKFPKWMGKENWLPRLQILRLESCTSLKIVPFLPPRLQSLKVENCHELMQLPPLSDTLLTLTLIKCPKLQALANLSPTVINLTIQDCPNLTLPSTSNKPPTFCDLSALTNLEYLCLKEFPNLQALTNLSPTVYDLWIENCPKLASLGNLQRCTYLLIRRCPMLKREEPSVVEGVVEGDIANRLPQVEHIETDEPLLVLELVQQQAFSSIKSLTVTDCAAALPNLENLSSLHSLHINRYPDIESLPNLPVSLQSIWIHECPKLKEKYEEGGPLRNTISHIPRIVFHNSNLDCM